MNPISRTTMLLFICVIHSLLYIVKTLPAKDYSQTDEEYVPNYASPSLIKTENTYDSEEDDELSGDSDEIMEDYIKRPKKEHIPIWKLNLKQIKDQKYMVEADIRLDSIQYENEVLQKLRNSLDKNFPSSRKKRAARIQEPGYLWKNNTIYYKIDSGFPKPIKHEIKRGIKHWKKTMKNCLKFIRLDRDPKLEARISKEHFGGGPVEHILFKRTLQGCWSQVGRTDTNLGDKYKYVEGQQLISIGEGCGEKGTVIHEIGHAVGFWHEQSRRDRDNYVKIVRANIFPSQFDQFKRMSNRQTSSMDYAYDFWSVMHYGPTFFSKNGRPTIRINRKYRPLKPKIGQRNRLSYLDVAQVRAMYKCNAIPSLESKNTCIKTSTKGRDYTGNLDYTKSGVMCQPWNKQYPHEHKYNMLVKNEKEGLGRHNHCRNPNGSKKKPWCYTTKNQLEWEYCDLDVCEN